MMGKMKGKWRFAVLIAVLFLCLIPKAFSNNGFDALRLKWDGLLTGGVYDPADPEIAARIQVITQTAQQHWETMDQSENRTVLWSDKASLTNPTDITRHFERLRDMALAYRTVGSPLFGNTELLQDVISGLDWTYTNRYNETVTRYGNWWEWDIGTPLAVNDAVVLLYNELPAGLIQNLMTAVDHFCPTPEGTTPNDRGANRVWKSTIVAVRGILVGDEAQITLATQQVATEFDYVTSSDGFYRDGSFIQHARHPYNGGYGKSFLDSLSNLLYLLDDSAYEITTANKANVYRWVYDSFEPLIYKGAFMDMTRGRNISRYQEQDHVPGHVAIRAIEKLSRSASPADSLAYKRMIKYWVLEDTSRSIYANAPIGSIAAIKAIMNDPSVTPRGELVLHKRYPSMDRTVHLRPGFGFGISMNSERIYRYEVGNGENVQGWHTSDGMTYLYNNDLTAYSDHFWATVDYKRLPGTTVDTVAKTRDEAEKEKKGSASWVGGSDILGLYGVTGMELTGYNTTLKAKKSWFLFDDEVVNLGAGISSTDNRTIETIVENRKLNADATNVLTVNGVGKPSSLGWLETMAGVQWAHLEGTGGYVFPGSAEVKGLREARTATWQDVNTYYLGDQNAYTRNYGTLWLDHGANPSDGTYSYITLPNQTAQETADYSASPDVTILSNTPEIQAVRENGLNLTGINFWTPYRVQEPVASYSKASVMVRETDSQIEVAVSDPTQLNAGVIKLEINRYGLQVVSKDPEISVSRLNPTIILTVNVNKSYGKSFHAVFAKDGTVTLPPLPQPEEVTAPAPSTAPYVENGGQVVFEAEKFATKTSLAATLKNSWEFEAAIPGYSGPGLMVVSPDNGNAKSSSGYKDGPGITYQINFSAAGTYYVWVRGYGIDTSGDSVHVGLDGAEITSGKQVELGTGSYQWKNLLAGTSNRAQITIASPGVHTFHLWMREDGARVDKIILTRNAAYVPTGAGPAESARDTE